MDTKHYKFEIELESDDDIEISNCIACFEEFENDDEYNDLCVIYVLMK